MKASFNIDLTNPKVTCAIAGQINSAFETGIGSWFEVNMMGRKQKEHSFFIAAFADNLPNSKSLSPLESDWGPVTTNWMLRARLNDDGEPVTKKWTLVTPALAVERWKRAARTYTEEGIASLQYVKPYQYLRVLDLMSNGHGETAEMYLFENYEPDGVHDDILAQVAIHGEVIFG